MEWKKQCLTVRSRGAVKSDLHRNIQPVLHHEGRANSNDLPGTALHCDGEDHSDWRQGRKLTGRMDSHTKQQVTIRFKFILSIGVVSATGLL